MKKAKRILCLVLAACLLLMTVGCSGTSSSQAGGHLHPWYLLRQ